MEFKDFVQDYVKNNNDGGIFFLFLNVEINLKKIITQNINIFLYLVMFLL